MIPLTLANVGEETIIRKIGGRPEVQRHLENLGFTAGGSAVIVSEISGDLIVKVKDARIAVNKDMAQKIMVQTDMSSREEHRHENYERSEDRRECEGHKAPWGRRHKAQDHGHGHHERH